MSGRWWRAYDGAVDDPKLCLLTHKQHRDWFNLCCITSQNGGTLPSIAEIAFKLHMTVEKAKHAVAELVALGLIDTNDDRMTMHNWHKRQFKSDVTDPTAAKRMRNYRNRNRNATVTVTPPRDRDRDRYSVPKEGTADEIVGEDQIAKLFRVGKTILVSFGVAEKRTGALIGQWLKTKNDPVGLLAAIQFAREQNVAEPVAYISAMLQGKSNGHARQNLVDLCHELANEARERERAIGISRPDAAFGGG